MKFFLLILRSIMNRESGLVVRVFYRLMGLWKVGELSRVGECREKR